MLRGLRLRELEAHIAGQLLRRYEKTGRCSRCRRVLALLVVDPRTGDVQRAEGDAFHLERLSRDVTRALGTFAPPAAPA